MNHRNVSESSPRSVYLADEQWATLRDIATQLDRPVNWVVRQAVSEYLMRRMDSVTYVDVLTEVDPVALYGRKVYTSVDRIGETRDPSDEEARPLRKAYPHLAEPKIVDPNRRTK